MKTRSLTRALLVGMTLAGLAGLLLPAAAGADLTVKEQMKMSGIMGMISSDGTETTYIKGAKMRVESEMEMGGMLGGMAEAEGVGRQVTIMRPDKGVIWFVDSDDSTYTEVALGAGAGDSLRAAGMKVKDVKVTETGKTKEIVGYKCKGIAVDMTIEITMEDGDERRVQTQEARSLFWMRPEVSGLEELRGFWDRMMDLARSSQEDEAMSGAMNAMFAKVRDIEGVPLGIEVTMDNVMGGAGADEQQQAEMEAALEMMRQMMKGDEGAAADDVAEEGAGLNITRYVTAISKGALSDALFEIPKGYTKTKGFE